MAEILINSTEAGRARHRKERVGEVISNKMIKTIVVRVERRFPHPKFKKVVTAYRSSTPTTKRARRRWATGCALKRPGPFPRSNAGGWWR